MDSVGDVPYGNFVLWPVREERLKEVSAYFSMQATHSIHGSASTNGEIGHVETLGRVIRILAAQGQQIVECYAEFLFCIPSEVLFDESGSEAIKSGSHSGVGSEDVSRSRDGQCAFKWLPGFFHKTASTLERSKGCMPFI